MGSFGGFYKGEKKKKRKEGREKPVGFNSPTFTLPKIITKKVKYE